MAWIGAIVSTVAGGALSSYSAGETKDDAKKMRRQMERIQRAEKTMQSYRAAKERKGQIQEALVKRAQIENVGAATGMTGSSAVVASKGFLSQQAGSNISDLNTRINQSNEITDLESELNSLKMEGPSYESQIAGQLGSQLFTQGFQAFGQAAAESFNSNNTSQ